VCGTVRAGLLGVSVCCEWKFGNSLWGVNVCYVWNGSSGFMGSKCVLCVWDSLLWVCWE